MKPIVCITLIFLCLFCLSPAVQAESLTTYVTFSKSGQNMWGAGSAFTFDKSWFIGLDPDPVGGNIVNLVWNELNVGARFYGGLDLKAGLDLGMKINSGGVDISYPVGVNFTFPDTITEGEMITIGSSFTVKDGASLNTTFPSITPKAEAVLKVDADLDIDVHYIFDESKISLVDIHKDYRYDLLGALGIPTATGDSETYELGFGNIQVTIPGDLDTVGTLSGGKLIASTGEFSGEFLDARVNLLSLGELIPPPVGTAFKVFNEVESGGVNHTDSEYVFKYWLNWNMIDLDAGAIARITQDFEFVPDELMVDLYTKDGNKLTSFNVGDPVEIFVPEGGLELTPVFSLDNTFTNETGLRIDPAFHILLVETEGFLSIDIPVIGRILSHESLSFGPLFEEDWIAKGFEIPVYTNDFAVDFGSVRGDSFYLGNGGPIPIPGQVPEPATLLLLGSGLIGLAGYGRKKFFKK